MSSSESPSPGKKVSAATPTPCGKTISATELFAGGKEVCIEHAGVRYRLRITRRNRLILQK